MKEVFDKIWEMALPYQDQREDPGHAQITLKYAMELVKRENGNEDVIIPAIILHDIGWSQLVKERRFLIFDKEAKEEDRLKIRLEHQSESVRLATEILHRVDYPGVLAAEILEIISQHDTRKGFISKNEGLARDADKLWRTSKEGVAAAQIRRKPDHHPRWEKIEEDIKKPDYFFSETARQIALTELKFRMRETLLITER